MPAKKASISLTTKTLYFLTGNAHKLREARDILTDYSIEALSLELDEIQGLDPESVMAHKLQQAAQATDLRPLICEDVSLNFAAYHRLPGPLVKWFIEAAPQGDGALLLQMMQGQRDRRAQALCLYALLDTNEEMHYARGEVQGQVATELRGANGFGWDPLFIPEGHSQSFAEMPAETKRGISHRRRALEALRRTLAQL